ncbi:MAG TPA: SGNH/GDSL hydrolase family protein [Kofleriaceae bacterium]|nr:SGNH/GDSL hydrolase family protein [Kofleriaceae bacterium]
MDIYCFGDSITFGEYDHERGGWVDRIKIACMARYVAQGEPEDCVFNLGIGGETTEMMRARLTAELDARLDPEARSLVMFAYGANDAAECDGSFRVAPTAYVEHLAWAIEEARRRRCDVWLLNITPVAPVADGVRNPMGRLRTSAAVAAYNTALAALAQRTATPLVDVHGAFGVRDPSALFAADGIHPNAAGHAIIADLVSAKLTTLDSRSTDARAP